MMKSLKIQQDHARDLYLDLLMKSLVNWIYLDHEKNLRPYQRIHLGKALRCLLQEPSRFPFRRLWVRCLRFLKLQPPPKRFDLEEKRMEGRDWSPVAHTMIGVKRLQHLQDVVQTVLSENIKGDFVETGVWRGGACIYMRGLLKAYGVTDRIVWCADSFQGLPRPDAQTYPEDQNDIYELFPQLSVPIEGVKSNFERYGLLDDQVRFLQGWFNDSLPKAPIQKLAILRLDGDMYQSTMDALLHLYHKVEPRGFVIIDDYQLEPCRKAVMDFKARIGCSAPIEKIDWASSFWRKVEI